MATRPNYFTVTLDGEDLGTFDDDELTLTDSFTFENNAGMTLDEMLDGVNTLRPKALRALVWWMRYKQGKTVDLLAIDFKLKSLKVESVVFADPSKARGRTSKNATTTSPPSPTSAI